jgi:MinD-like ATPase involved in chromosome partitioning or flagellar assembly
MRSVVVCAGGAGWELPLLRDLQGSARLRVERRCTDEAELLGFALRDRPDAALVAAELPWLDRDLVGRLTGAGVAVVVVGAAEDDGADPRVHRLPADADAETVARLVHDVAGGPASADPTGSEASGRLVAVWGATGAPGRTTVAVHLAIEAARAERSTLLLDGDAWSASIAQVLELAESPSVAQAARAAGDGRSDPLDGAVQRGPDSLAVLAGLPRAELWPEVGPEAWRALLDAATRAYDVVVVDVAAPIEEDEELVVDRIPFRRNVMTTTALEHAETVLLVVAADPVGLRRGIVAQRQLASRGGALGVDVVLNRLPQHGRRLQDCSRAVEAWIGSPPVAFLPHEPAFTRVAWEGRALHAVAPRSRWLRELRGLAAAVAA